MDVKKEKTWSSLFGRKEREKDLNKLFDWGKEEEEEEEEEEILITETPLNVKKEDLVKLLWT